MQLPPLFDYGRAPSAGFAAGGRPSDTMMHNQPFERKGLAFLEANGPQSITALIHGTAQRVS
jgi:hypothetical protein